VRIFRVQEGGAGSPQKDLAPAFLKWSLPSNETLPGFSATCWLAARNLFVALGGSTPVGVIQSAVGGTAVRNWAPTKALAMCPQPYNSPDRYGTHPYEHAVLYNAMIAPFSTGPTAFTFVLWDQAESDSFPQTPLGYYGCQTIAQINSWRVALKDASLPWVFVHLQPYTGSGPCCLAELRAMQLQATGLPNVGFASAIDLGDPSSPAGNVHFRHKQVVAERVVGAVLRLAFNHARAEEGATAYPPPMYLDQSVSTSSTGQLTVNVSFSPGGEATDAFTLVFGATVDEVNQSSAVCPKVAVGNCSGFEILTNDGVWHPAKATITAGGRQLQLQASASDFGDLQRAPYAVGSRYAWNAWPLATLFEKGGLPILPWEQALTMMPPKATFAVDAAASMTSFDPLASEQPWLTMKTRPSESSSFYSI